MWSLILGRILLVLLRILRGSKKVAWLGELGFGIEAFSFCS